MKEDDIDRIAEAITAVIRNKEAGIAEAAQIVAQLTARYPLDACSFTSI